jgi:hypothetical protein
MKLSLSEKVFLFEVEISGREFASEVLNEISRLKHLKDVKEYYLDYRGWRGNDSLEDLLIDFIINLKMENI